MPPELTTLSPSTNTVEGEKKSMNLEVITLPSDVQQKRNLLTEYAPFIHYAYAKKYIPWEQLAQEKKDIAIGGLMEADKLVVARDEDGIVRGLLAYTILSREKNSPFFHHVDTSPYWQQDRDALRNALADIESIFITNEMVVDKEHQGNGLSHEMREYAFKNLSGQTIALIGEIQSYKSLKQRKKAGGATWWSGEIVYGSENAAHITSQLAHALGRAYIATFHQQRLQDYESTPDGIFPSDLFEQKVEEPKQLENDYVRRAFRHLLLAQELIPNEALSAIAVTITKV